MACHKIIKKKAGRSPLIELRSLDRETSRRFGAVTLSAQNVLMEFQVLYVAVEASRLKVV